MSRDLLSLLKALTVLGWGLCPGQEGVCGHCWLRCSLPAGLEVADLRLRPTAAKQKLLVLVNMTSTVSGATAFNFITNFLVLDGAIGQSGCASRKLVAVRLHGHLVLASVSEVAVSF